MGKSVRTLCRDSDRLAHCGANLEGGFGVIPGVGLRDAYHV